MFPVPDFEQMEFACKRIFQNDFPPPQHKPKPEDEEDQYLLTRVYKTNKTMVYRSNRAYLLAQQTIRISGPGKVGNMDFVMEESDEEGNLPPKRDPVYLREMKGYFSIFFL